LVDAALPTEDGCCELGSLRIDEGALLLLLLLGTTFRTPRIGAQPGLNMPDEGAGGSVEVTVSFID